MSLALIRVQVKAILDAVSGIGVVHNRERWAADPARLADLFKVRSQLHGWTISRTQTPSTYRSNQQIERRHQLILKGYMAWSDQDDTATTFDALIEAIVEAFDGNDTLNGTCEWSGPLQVASVTPAMFAGVLCHYCELHLAAQELVTAG
jgi:hypothetical protein